MKKFIKNLSASILLAFAINTQAAAPSVLNNGVLVSNVFTFVGSASNATVNGNRILTASDALTETDPIWTAASNSIASDISSRISSNLAISLIAQRFDSNTAMIIIGARIDSNTVMALLGERMDSNTAMNIISERIQSNVVMSILGQRIDSNTVMQLIAERIDSNTAMGLISARIDSNTVMSLIGTRADSNIAWQAISSRIDSNTAVNLISERIDSNTAIGLISGRIESNVVMPLISGRADSNTTWQAINQRIDSNTAMSLLSLRADSGIVWQALSQRLDSNTAISLISSRIDSNTVMSLIASRADSGIVWQALSSRIDSNTAVNLISSRIDSNTAMSLLSDRISSNAAMGLISQLANSNTVWSNLYTRIDSNVAMNLLSFKLSTNSFVNSATVVWSSTNGLMSAAAVIPAVSETQNIASVLSRGNDALGNSVTNINSITMSNLTVRNNSTVAFFGDGTNGGRGVTFYRSNAGGTPQIEFKNHGQQSRAVLRGYQNDGTTAAFCLSAGENTSVGNMALTAGSVCNPLTGTRTSDYTGLDAFLMFSPNRISMGHFDVGVTTRRDAFSAFFSYSHIAGSYIHINSTADGGILYGYYQMFDNHGASLMYADFTNSVVLFGASAPTYGGTVTFATGTNRANTNVATFAYGATRATRFSPANPAPPAIGTAWSTNETGARVQFMFSAYCIGNGSGGSAIAWETMNSEGGVVVTNRARAGVAANGGSNDVFLTFCVNTGGLYRVLDVGSGGAPPVIITQEWNSVRF